MSIDNTVLKTNNSHYHCYLLRSLDPKHPNITYVGFTVNPWRRIRQHNGILKGGARKTERSGRTWIFAVVIHGFPSQKSALQFEWAWQHCDKSLAVRAVLGDDASKKLKRKQGLKGQLWILKTLVTLCPDLFRHQSLSLFFFDETTRQIYHNIRPVDQVSKTFSKDWGIHTRVVHSLQDMPFWSTRNKGWTSKQSTKAAGREDVGNENKEENFQGYNGTNSKENHKESYHPKKRTTCMYCHHAILPHEISSGKEVNMMHEICRELCFDEDEESSLNINQSSLEDESISRECSIGEILNDLTFDGGKHTKISIHFSKTKDDQANRRFSTSHRPYWDDKDSDESYPSFHVSESSECPNSNHVHRDKSIMLVRTSDWHLGLSSFASLSISPENKSRSVTGDSCALMEIQDGPSIVYIDSDEEAFIPSAGPHFRSSNPLDQIEIVDLRSP